MTIPAQASRASRTSTLVTVLGLLPDSGVLAGRVAIIEVIPHILRAAGAEPRSVLRRCAAPSSARAPPTTHRDAVRADLPAHLRGVCGAPGRASAAPERGRRTRGTDRGR